MRLRNWQVSERQRRQALTTLNESDCVELSLIASVARAHELPISLVRNQLRTPADLMNELAQLRYRNVQRHVHHILENDAHITLRRIEALKSDDPDERLAAAIVGKN